MINSNQFSAGQIDGARNTAALQTQQTAPTEATRAARAAQETAGVRPANGLSAGTGAGAIGYSSASLEGIDWEALADDVASTDTMSITLSEIMVLLVKTMADMRTGQRDAWMADAQNALAMGLNAADRMRESAAAKLACDCISNGTAIITSGMQMASQGATALKQINVSKAVNVEALAQKEAQAMAAGLKPQEIAQDALKPAELAGDAGKLGQAGELADDFEPVALEGTPQWNENPMYVKPDDAIAMAEGPSATATASSVAESPPQEAPQSQATGLDGVDAVDEKAPVDAQAEAPTTQQEATKTDAAQSEPVKADATKTEGATPEKDLATRKNDLRLQNQKTDRWATQEKAARMEGWNAKVGVFNKALEIAGHSSKMLGAGLEYMSSIKQAEAQEARSRGEFYNTLANAELDFANELRDNLKGVLDNMKSMEASRHQAMQGIYNI